MSWFDDWEAIEAVGLNDDPVEQALGRARPEVRGPVERVLGKHGDLTTDEAEMLLHVEGDDLIAIVRAAETAGARA